MTPEELSTFFMQHGFHLKMKYGFAFGMFVEDGTLTPIFDIIQPYESYNGGFGIEIFRRKK